MRAKPRNGDGKHCGGLGGGVLRDLSSVHTLKSWTQSTNRRSVRVDRLGTRPDHRHDNPDDDDDRS